MSSFFDPKLPPSKSSPFVNGAAKTGGPVHKPSAAKPVTTPSKVAKEKQPPQAEVKKPKVKPVAVTIATAAGMLEASQPTIRRWIKCGKLQHFRVGRVIRIRVGELVRLMEARG